MTFFSGTDMHTMKIEGNDRNHFLSLIVNNEGVYNAKITRKVASKICEKHHVETESESSYNTYENVKVDIETTPKTENFERLYEESVVEIYSAEITKQQEIKEDYSELDARIEEIKEKKKTEATRRPLFTSYDWNRDWDYSLGNMWNDYDTKYKQSPKLEHVIDTNGASTKVRRKAIYIIYRLFIGKIILSREDLAKSLSGVINQADKLYESNFKLKKGGDVEFFHNFISEYVDFLISNSNCDNFIELQDEIVNILMEIESDSFVLESVLNYLIYGYGGDFD